MAKRKDFYKVLEIPKTDDPDEIRKAYKKLALKHHPDKNNSTEESRKEAEKKFKEIAEAYSVLSDKNKKYRYDNGLDIEEEMGMGGVDPTNIFNMFFGGGGGGGGGVPGGFSFANMNGGDVKFTFKF